MEHLSHNTLRTKYLYLNVGFFEKKKKKVSAESILKSNSKNVLLKTKYRLLIFDKHTK